MYKISAKSVSVVSEELRHKKRDGRTDARTHGRTHGRRPLLSPSVARGGDKKTVTEGQPMVCNEQQKKLHNRGQAAVSPI